MPTPQEFMNALPADMRDQAANLSNYINTEIKANRQPNPRAVERMKEIVDYSRVSQPNGGMLTNSLNASQQRTSDLVTEMAKVEVYIENCQSRGVQAESGPLLRQQELFALAKARLSPAQYADASKLVNEAKAQIHQTGRLSQPDMPST